MIKEKSQLKVVVKAKDMDDDIFRNIETWAKEIFEDPKVKYKDEMVKFLIS